MRLATWNLERATASGPRADRLREYMRRIKADIWVLTETDSRLAPEEAASPVASAIPERRHRKDERWTVIWSRKHHLEPVATEDPVRTACARLCRAVGPPMLIYGTVLPWRADVRFRPLRGGDAFCHALARQADDWTRLLQENPDHVLCVAGDFNQEIDSPCRVGTWKGERALTQALEDVGLVCLSSGANDPLRRRTNGARNSIDHICVSSRLVGSTTMAECWPEQLDDLTDHYGTSVELPDA